MLFSKEEINNTLSNYRSLTNKLNDILYYYGNLDKTSYDIVDVTLEDDSLIIETTFYKWQEDNSKIFEFNLNLLTDESVFEKFKNDMNLKILKQVENDNLKLLKYETKEIMDAIKLLKNKRVL